MNKIIFKVDGPKTGSISDLIKGIRKFECRIHLDFEHNLVTVENASDKCIDDVIDFLNTYYILLSADINNMDVPIEPCSEKFETEQSESPDKSETSNFTSTLGNEENKEAETPHDDIATYNDELPASIHIPEDFTFPKIVCSNYHLGHTINSLLYAISWVMNKDKNEYRRIASMLWTCIREIRTRYEPKPIIECSVGDVVDCFFGTQLPNEINGAHIYSIVMEIRPDNMIYVVPANKILDEITSTSTLPLSVPQDVTYSNDKYAGDTAYIDRAVYIPATRVQKVVGKVSPEAMARIIELHNSTFDFRNKSTYSLDKIPEPVAEDSTPSKVPTSEEPVTPNASLETIAQNVETSAVIFDVPHKTQEELLTEVISNALLKLNKEDSILKSIRTFLEEIGMPADNPIVNEAFVVACDIKKINYENVVAAILEGISELNSELTEEVVKTTLKDTFNNWVASKPKLANCKRLAFTSLLKLFVKTIR